MNLNEIRSAIMGTLSGNPKDEPMHYGEVFATWTNLFTNNGLMHANINPVSAVNFVPSKIIVIKIINDGNKSKQNSTGNRWKPWPWKEYGGEAC